MPLARTIDRRLFFLFDRAHTELSKQADLFLSGRSGVSTAQAAVLIYLGYHDRCRPTDLAKGIGRNNAAVTGLVERMEKAGLVERIPDYMDRRAKAIALTEQGWARRVDVMEDFREFNDNLVKGLTESEIEAVYKFLAISTENTANLAEIDKN